jgi:phospholipid/cholesterol/gamma-HCH transport system substrate-binding protein
MRNIKAEVLSGVAIFVAFVIFVGGFLYLKSVIIKAGTYEIEVVFDDIIGLEPKDKVSISGLEIGRVQRFTLEGLRVIVDLQLDPEVQIPNDSRAEIKSLGMVGEKFIDILPGQSPSFLQEGNRIEGSTAGDLMKLTGSAEGLMLQAEELIIDMKAAFRNIFDVETQQNLRQTLNHVHQISESLSKESSTFERVIENLDRISGNLDEILNERRAQVETSINNLYEASNKLDGLTQKMDQSLSSMQTLLAKVENEEGTVGKVIARDEIYNDIRHLTSELDTLLQDLKRRPQKYINLGFIKVF